MYIIIINLDKTSLHHFFFLQFRQVGPAQQSQQFNPVPSQHFYPVGRGVPLMNVGLPPQSLQPQFSQPMQQFPPRAGQPGHATLPSQAIPLPIAQPNMHITSENLMPQINAQTPNNYSPGLGGPERPLSSSYTVRFWSVPISEFIIYSNLLGLDFI
jgi:pre-mRNA-processing factor 40